MAWGLTFPEASVRDDAASARYARKACDLGDRRGCAMLGLALLEGRGVKEDRPRG
jgi:TPR repeat protein